MKKIFLILILALSLTGCALVGAQKEKFDACMADVGCHKKFDEAVAKGSTLGTLIGVLGGPGAAAAGGVAGGGLGGLAVALHYGGQLLKKRKEEDAKNTQ